MFSLCKAEISKKVNNEVLLYNINFYKILIQTFNTSRKANLSIESRLRKYYFNFQQGILVSSIFHLYLSSLSIIQSLNIITILKKDNIRNIDYLVLKEFGDLIKKLKKSQKSDLNHLIKKLKKSQKSDLNET